MRRQTVTVVAPPAVEPVTAEDLAAFAKIDEYEDSHLESFLIAAREAAEKYTNRSFIARTLKVSLDGAWGREPWTPGYYELPVNYFDGSLPHAVELPMGPVIAVTTITTYDTLDAGTVYAADRYGVFGDRLVLNAGESWPSGLRTIFGTEIVYTAGFGPSPDDVPRPIRMAITMHAQALYDGTCGCDIPAQCLALLNPYRILSL